MLKNFTREELQCPGTKKVHLALGFGEALQGLRDAYGKPLKINSACRSAEYNRAVLGHPRSLHVYDSPHWPTGGCCAVDVAMTDGFERGRLIKVAWERGWSIGLAKTFLHLDMRTMCAELPQTTYYY
jgi:hypothetical protein